MVLGFFVTIFLLEFAKIFRGFDMFCRFSGDGWTCQQCEIFQHGASTHRCILIIIMFHVMVSFFIPQKTYELL